MQYPLRLLLGAPPSVRLQPETFVYVAAVEAQDGQALEPSVVTALDAFVVGCKADGIWNAIMAACILAGARTLSGALVPLVGTAPTNFNFVSGDYNRKTGLVGDGSTKYLNSNRNNNADPQNNQHLSVFASSAGGGGVTAGWIGCASGTGSSGLCLGVARSRNANNNSTADAANFRGLSRNESATFLGRADGTTSSFSRASQSPLDSAITVFLGNAVYGNPRLAFYSIGESLDLALLDARVTTLINAIGAAIP